jgi:hypothetical protein
MITNSDVCLCFDQVSLIEVLAGQGRTADLLVSAMARRAPTKLSSDPAVQSQSVLGKNVLNA